ncbi:MAG: hypothetical protein RLZZ450_737 [Pseudomonadota bacterium]|jgi:hypothetical protein
MIVDERGSTYVETLIALPVIFIAFIALFMFARLSVAHLIVQRAAAASVRAAVVILPDDPEYYGVEGAATKDECIVEAARRVLMASPHFLTDAASIDLKVKGSKVGFEPLTVELRARYDCGVFLGSIRFFSVALCGPDRVAILTSSSTLPYQAGPLEK